MLEIYVSGIGDDRKNEGKLQAVPLEYSQTLASRLTRSSFASTWIRETLDG